MLKIALTGSIASGKSAILRFFAQQGIPTIDADEIVKALYRRREVKEKVLALFHTFDRKAIASQIFSSPSKRKELEELLHPLVGWEIKEKMRSLQEKGEKMVVVEVPLLFEADLQKLFDRAIAVKVSKQEQIARLKRQGLSEKEFLLRINSQLSTEEKVKKADFVIDNNGSLQHAFKQAEKILRQLNG